LIFLKNLWFRVTKIMKFRIPKPERLLIDTSLKALSLYFWQN
jgi:hypothetical protein